MQILILVPIRCKPFSFLGGAYTNVKFMYYVLLFLVKGPTSLMYGLFY